MPQSVLHVPAHDISVPSSISKEAQEILSGFDIGLDVEEPDSLDPGAWKACVRESDDAVLALIRPRAESWKGAHRRSKGGRCDGIRLDTRRGDRE